MIATLILLSLIAFSSADDVVTIRPTNGLPGAIPDNGFATFNGPYWLMTAPAPSNANFRVKEIQVTIQTNHTYYGDLICAVFSPSLDGMYFLYRSGIDLSTGFGLCNKIGGNVTYSDKYSMYMIETFCPAGGTPGQLASPITVFPASSFSPFFYGAVQTGQWEVDCFDAKTGNVGHVLDVAITIYSGLIVNPPTSYTIPSGVQIPDGNTTGVTISVNIPNSLIIQYMEVDLTIYHNRLGQVSARLTHVNTGTSIFLMRNPQIGRPGFIGNNYCVFPDAEITLTDTTTRLVDTTCYLFKPAVFGRHAPSEPLTAFNGEDAAGTWQLTVIDGTASIAGNVSYAALYFDTVGRGVTACTRDVWEPNNFSIEAFTLVFPVAGQSNTYTLNACNSGDVEWFRFVATSNTTLRVTLTQTSANDPWAIYMMILGTGGTLTYIAQVTDLSVIKLFNVAVTVGNTYYIWAFAASNPISTGVTLELRNTATALTSGLITTGEPEVTTGARRSVTTGAETSGSLTSGDVTTSPLTSGALTSAQLTSGVVTTGIAAAVTTGSNPSLTSGLVTTGRVGSSSSSSASSDTSIGATTSDQNESGASSLFVSVVLLPLVTLMF